MDYSEKTKLLTPFAGVGYRHKNVFAEVNFYQGMGSGFPLSKRVLTTTIGIQQSF